MENVPKAEPPAGASHSIAPMGPVGLEDDLPSLDVPLPVGHVELGPIEVSQVSYIVILLHDKDSDAIAFKGEFENSKDASGPDDPGGLQTNIARLGPLVQWVCRLYRKPERHIFLGGYDQGCAVVLASFHVERHGRLGGGAFWMECLNAMLTGAPKTG